MPMNSVKKENPAKKFCLITGSANGLGFEFSKIFASNGYSLVLVDKDGEGLKKKQGILDSENRVELVLFEEDLSKKGSALNVYNYLTKMNIHPEVLINNAGFGNFGFFVDSNWEKQEELIKLLVLNTTHLTRLFLPKMLANKNGRIVNIASLAAFQPGPLMSVYHASKAFLLSFSLALSNELKGTGVVVSVLCPGVMATNFQKTNKNENPKLKWTLGSAEKVAKIGYKGIMKGKTVIIPGIMNKSAAGLSRFLPMKFITQTVRTIQEKNRRDFMSVSTNNKY